MDKDIMITHLTFLCDKWKELVDHLEKEIANLEQELKARDEAFEDICEDLLDSAAGDDIKGRKAADNEAAIWKFKYEECYKDLKASINENKFIREQIQKLNFSINPKTVK